VRFTRWVTGDGGRLAAGGLVAVILFVSLLGAWSIRCRRRFSYDSMVYVDTGRHIAAGKGIAHSVAGAHSSRLPLRVALPEPLVSQPPGYPLLIATSTFLGITEEDGALATAAMAYLAVLLLCWRLVGACFGPAGGALATLLLLLLAPLRDAAASAWSETPALALWAGAAVVLMARPSGALSLVAAWAGGLLLGLSFATRYAFWPAVPVFLLTLLPWRGGWRAVLRRAVAVGFGALVPVGLVLGRNTALGMPMGEPRAPATTSLFENARLALGSLLGQWGGREGAGLQMAVAVGVLTVAGVLWTRADAGPRRAGRLLLLWALAYTAALVLQASVVYFDPLSPRFLLPASVALLVWVGGVVGAKLARPAPVFVALLLVAISLSGWQAWLLARNRPRAEAQVVDGSERLGWLRDHTTPRDLILGQTTAEIAFYLRRPSVSILAAPRYRPVTFEEVMTLVTSACKDYRWVYLELGKAEADSDEAWGPFLGDLLRGKTCPGWQAEGSFADGQVLRFVGPCGGGGPAGRGRRSASRESGSHPQASSHW
jgi:hypothetical protein